MEEEASNDQIEKTLRRLESWRESHLKKLTKCKYENSEKYKYSKRRIGEIEEQIKELEIELCLLGDQPYNRDQNTDELSDINE
jgi:phenylacetate-coenzyme A ligase PaaK-like adenylate-forming protein